MTTLLANSRPTWPVDLAAIFLLAITPVTCLYISHGYPLNSEAFRFFALSAVIIALIGSLVSRWQVTRYLVYWAGIAILIRYLAGISLESALFAALLTLLVFRRQIGGAALFTTVAVLTSSLVYIKENRPTTILAANPEPSLQMSRESRPVFHLVFDEAAGPVTLRSFGDRGRDIAAEMSRVLATHGFVEFTNAHSTAVWTSASLSDMANLGELDEEWVEKIVPSKKLLERVADQGYEINIIQSAHLNFCTDRSLPIYRCYEYPMNSLSYLSDNDLDQLHVTVPATLQLLWLLRRANQILPDTSLTRKVGLGKPQELPSQLLPLHQRQLQEELWSWAQTDNGIGNRYYFAHIVYPHFPYFQTPDCQIKPPFLEWGDPERHRSRVEGKIKSSLQAEDRDLLNESYLDQYACLSRQLDQTINRILTVAPNATIIVHGDHSARISTRLEGDLSTENYRDLFPLLLAIRTPETTATEVTCRLSLVEFAQRYFEGEPKPPGPRSIAIAEGLEGDNTKCGDLTGVLPEFRDLPPAL